MITFYTTVPLLFLYYAMKTVRSVSPVHYLNRKFIILNVFVAKGRKKFFLAFFCKFDA